MLNPFQRSRQDGQIPPISSWLMTTFWPPAGWAMLTSAPQINLRPWSAQAGAVYKPCPGAQSRRGPSSFPRDQDPMPATPKEGQAT